MDPWINIIKMNFKSISRKQEFDSYTGTAGEGLNIMTIN